MTSFRTDLKGVGQTFLLLSLGDKKSSTTPAATGDRGGPTGIPSGGSPGVPSGGSPGVPGGGSPGVPGVLRSPVAGELIDDILLRGVLIILSSIGVGGAVGPAILGPALGPSVDSMLVYLGLDLVVGTGGLL